MRSLIAGAFVAILVLAGVACTSGEEEPQPVTASPTAAATAGPPPSVRFTTISVGERHACGLDRAGFAYCWGLDDAGRD